MKMAYDFEPPPREVEPPLVRPQRFGVHPQGSSLEVADLGLLGGGWEVASPGPVNE